MASIDLKKITIGQLAGEPSNERLIRQIFDGMKYKVVYEPNMGDYLLCHAAFVLPAALACYKTDGDLKRLKGNTAYFSRMIDANIEGYHAIKNAGHEILPKDDKDFEGEAYRKTCMRFFKLMCLWEDFTDTKSVTMTSTPVSSLTSRATVSAGSSPGSLMPYTMAHSPVSERLPRSTRPCSSST